MLERTKAVGKLIPFTINSIRNYGFQAIMAVIILMNYGCADGDVQADGQVVSKECIVGTYLVQEGSGTKALWTFSSDGTFVGTSSSQPIYNYSDQHGVWEITETGEIEVLLLDFSFDEDGVMKNTGRVDMVFDVNIECNAIEGSFTLRFFEADEDPLNPLTDTGEPTTDTFSGERVTL